MPDTTLFLFFLASSFLLYISAYRDTRRSKELKLPEFIKFIYGKRSKAIYNRACITQTFALLLGISVSLDYFAQKQDIPILVSARAILFYSISILAIAVLLDELLDRIRRM